MSLARQGWEVTDTEAAGLGSGLNNPSCRGAVPANALTQGLQQNYLQLGLGPWGTAQPGIY